MRVAVIRNRDRSSPARTCFSCTRGRSLLMRKRDQFAFRKLCWEALVETWVYRHNISACFSDVLSPLVVWGPGQLPGWLSPLSGPGHLRRKVASMPRKVFCVSSLQTGFSFLFMCCDGLCGVHKTLKSWLVEAFMNNDYASEQKLLPDVSWELKTLRVLSRS